MLPWRLARLMLCHAIDRTEIFAGVLCFGRCRSTSSAQHFVQSVGSTSLLRYSPAMPNTQDALASLGIQS